MLVLLSQRNYHEILICLLLYIHKPVKDNKPYQ